MDIDFPRLLRWAVFVRDSADGPFRLVSEIPDWWSDQLGVLDGSSVDWRHDYLQLFVEQEGNSPSGLEIWGQTPRIASSALIEIDVAEHDRLVVQGVLILEPTRQVLVVRSLVDADGLLVDVLRVARDASADHALAQARHRVEVAQIESDRAEAKRMERIKSEFLANMSHEVRTPLTTILALGEMALESDDEVDRQQKIQGIVEAARRLQHLSNDILDLSKIQAARLELHPETFNLRQSLELWRGEWQVHAERKKLEVKLNVSRSLAGQYIGDSFRLRQILTNLVGNAIKFMDRGIVQIYVEAATRSHHVSFTVVDTGIGIPPERITTIFESFYQVDATPRRRHEGAGLGLAIASNLVRLMGGELTVESRLGQGSRFAFTVFLPTATWSEISPHSVDSTRHLSSSFADANSQPQRSAESTVVVPTAPAKPVATAMSTNANRYRILVAEDHPINRMVIVETLVQKGHEVVEATDGREAVNAWELQPFDLILMDSQMPVMSGLDAVREIRRIEAEHHIPKTPILAITAHAMSDERCYLMEQGVDAYLSKPFERAELLQRVEELGHSCRG